MLVRTVSIRKCVQSRHQLNKIVPTKLLCRLSGHFLEFFFISTCLLVCSRKLHLARKYNFHSVGMAKDQSSHEFWERIILSFRTMHIDSLQTNGFCTTGEYRDMKHHHFRASHLSFERKKIILLQEKYIVVKKKKRFANS